MKTILLALGCLLGLASSLFAQRAQTSFYGSHLKREYRVTATQPNARGRYNLEIEMQSLDETSPEIYFVVQSRFISKWITTMEEVKTTYLKYREAAIENGVKGVSKIIKQCGALSYLCAPMFKYGDWHRVNYHPITFAFLVKGDDITLTISTGRITASNNQYIQSAGGVIILSSEQEIDDFIACFDENWVREYYNNNKATNDLFK